MAGTKETPDFENPGSVLRWLWSSWGKRIFIGIALIIGIRMVWKTAAQAYITVPVGNKAVVMVFGKISHVAPEGLNFVWPWVSTFRLIPLRVQKAVLKAAAVSKDTQKVTTEATIQWTFKPDYILETFEKVGAEDAMVDTIMMPKLNEALKAVTAKYPVGEILENREAIKTEIDDKFRTKVRDYAVNILDLNLTNLTFDADYEAAIERKQVAQVEVTTKANLADAARKEAQGEADAALIRAMGEAKAKRLLSSTVSPAVLQLEWIQAWKAGGSQVPQFIMGGNGGNFMMDLSKLKGTAPRPAPATEAAPAEDEK